MLERFNKLSELENDFEKLMFFCKLLTDSHFIIYL